MNNINSRSNPNTRENSDPQSAEDHGITLNLNF